jgi:antirestriction protein
MKGGDMNNEQQPTEEKHLGESSQSPEQEQREQPQIWVGSLLDYNNGILYGDWLDAARPADELEADIKALLAGSPTTAKNGDPADEWGIFDFEGFGSVRLGENESISYVSRLSQGIAEHGRAFAAWAEVTDDEASLDQFEEAYLGHYDSSEAYADQLVEDLGYQRTLDDVLPEHLRPYVNFNLAGLAQDLRLNGDIRVAHDDQGGVWIFQGDV